MWRGVRTQEFDGARRAPTRKGGHGPEAQAPGRVDERQDLRLAPPLDGEIAGPGRDRAARVDAGIMRNQRLGFGDSRKVPPHAVRQRSDRARRDGRALVDALEVDGHRLVPSPFSPAQHEFPIAHRPRLLEPLIHVRAAVGARPPCPCPPTTAPTQPVQPVKGASASASAASRLPTSASASHCPCQRQQRCQGQCQRVPVRAAAAACARAACARASVDRA